MNCDELRTRLTEYGEQALSAELCQEVERHLGECDSCAELKDDLRDLHRLCRECPPPKLPEALRERVAKMLEER